MSTTLEEIKVEVLHDFEQRDKCEYLSLYDVADRYEIEAVVDEVAERYAQYKTQELQEQNAELAKELAYVVKSLKTVSSFGATTPIIEHAEKILTKYQKP